jgi:amino acid adenylation domain-containing protein
MSQDRPAVHSNSESSSASGSARAAQRQRIDELRNHLSRQRWQTAQAATPLIERLKPGAPRLLSSTQQQLYLLQELHPGATMYNLRFAYLIEGELDERALLQALRDVTDRHQVLRSRVAVRNGEAVQEVEEAPLTLCVIDVPAANGGAADALHEKVHQWCECPFNLLHDFIFRPQLIRMSRTHHALVICVHHFAWDQWSNGLFARELGAFYAAALRGSTTALPELPLQYADYAAFERSRTSKSEADMHWWQELEGASNAELLTDYPRPASPTFCGARVSAVLPSQLSLAIEGYSQRHNVTPFIVMMAAFAVLLHRHTRESDLLMVTALANREFPELEQLIGVFVNMVPIRVQVGTMMNFDQLVAGVRDSLLKGAERGHVPFSRIVEAIRANRQLVKQPLFPIMLVDHAFPTHKLQLEGLRVTELELQDRTAINDLTVFVETCPEGKRLAAVYNTDLFTAVSIQRFLRQYLSLLARLIEEPTYLLAEVALPTSAEQHQIVCEWNDTQREYPSEACVHHLFERQAAITPDKIALVYAGERLTYAELNRRANHIAERLLASGIDLEQPVATYLDQSVELITAILGVLKAGACYLPLDASYPLARLQLMMDESGAPLLLTHPRMPSPPMPCSGRVLFLNDGENCDNAVTRTNPTNTAYIMFTSGSTGKPKGICVPHRAIMRLVCNSNYIDFGPGYVVAQGSNCSFDAATMEIWGALLHGGKLVGLSKETMLTSADLAGAVRAHRIDVLFMTPALFRQVAMDAPGTFAGLKYLVVGGDRLDPVASRNALLACPGLRLINGYGPTESTTFATWENVKEDLDDNANVLIGRPLSNTKVYVVDSFGQLAPVGAPGELWIGGDGLANGYVNRPELTAERFVPDPLSGNAGARCYRTGDLVRWRGNGKLEFLGRMDDQVKIRGFRVELDEVQMVLASCPGIRDSAVICVGEGEGEKKLAAYFVASDPLASEELRHWMQKRLPEYMVPHVFVSVPQIPLTSNGKVDRKKLPEARALLRERNTESAPPSTPVEQAVARMWKELLGQEPISVTDDFFQLGGHSLSGSRLVNQIREVFRIALPLRALFENPTVTGLAGAITQMEPSLGWAAKVARIWNEVSTLSEDQLQVTLQRKTGETKD